MLYFCLKKTSGHPWLLPGIKDPALLSHIEQSAHVGDFRAPHVLTLSLPTTCISILTN